MQLRPVATITFLAETDCLFVVISAVSPKSFCAAMESDRNRVLPLAFAKNCNALSRESGESCPQTGVSFYLQLRQLILISMVITVIISIDKF